MSSPGTHAEQNELPSIDEARVIFLNAVEGYLRSPDISLLKKRQEIAATVSAVTQLGMLAAVGK